MLFNIKCSVYQMSISRARVGNTRSVLESYSDTLANGSEKDNGSTKTTTAAYWEADIHPSPVLLCVIQGLSRLFLPRCVSVLCQTRAIKLTGHLIWFSQSLWAALEEHLFRLHFRARSCGLQIARDSICATEMSRAILNLISGWDGTLCLLKGNLWHALQQLPELSLLSWIATRGKEADNI